MGLAVLKSAGLHSFLEALEVNQLLVHLGCWQNSVLSGCRTEVSVFLLAVSLDHSQLLEATHIPWCVVAFLSKASDSGLSFSHASYGSSFFHCMSLTQPRNILRF